MQDPLSQLADAGWLMILGMGLVYAMLGVMVLATSLMSRFILRFSPLATSPSGLPDERPDAATLAAITAAVHMYRQETHSSTTADSKESSS